MSGRKIFHDRSALPMASADQLNVSNLSQNARLHNSSAERIKGGSCARAAASFIPLGTPVRDDQRADHRQCSNTVDVTGGMVQRCI